MVTENGAAYPDTVDGDGRVRDVDRRDYLARHVAAASDALQAGVPLTGYYVWSLLDNYEWSLGYTRRFGLVHVDFASQRRTPQGQRPLVPAPDRPAVGLAQAATGRRLPAVRVAQRQAVSPWPRGCRPAISTGNRPANGVSPSSAAASASIDGGRMP